MDKKQVGQQGGGSLLFKPITPAKTAGTAFTLATVAPTLLAILFIVVITALGLTAGESVQRQDWYLYCSYLLNPIAFALIAWGMLRWSKTPVREAIAQQKCEGKYFAIAILMQFGLLALSELNSLFLDFLAKFGYQSPEIYLPSMDGFGIVGVLLVIAVLPALLEETIFRGFLLKGVKSFGFWGAVLLSGGLFALYHQSPAQTVYQFCCGVAFALVAIKAGSILPTVLSHFLNNAYIVIMLKLGITAFPTPVYITLLILESLSLIAAIAWLFLDKSPKTGVLDKEETVQERKNFWIFAAIGLACCSLTWLGSLFTGFMG